MFNMQLEKAELNVELLLDRVIIKPLKIVDEKRASGILIPDFIKQRDQNVPRFGVIIAVGPGDPNRNQGKMTVKKDDLVSFRFYSGTPFEFNGETHLIMREFDIDMIVKEIDGVSKNGVYIKKKKQYESTNQKN